MRKFRMTVSGVADPRVTPQMLELYVREALQYWGGQFPVDHPLAGSLRQVIVSNLVDTTPVVK